MLSEEMDLSPNDIEPLARVLGKEWLELPQDLYVPPDALEVFLEAFEGPLDFLLYLIKKQNLDILDIPIAKITEQYLEYIELMKGLRFELAAEYLVMAASLAEIKSRLLLPHAPSLAEDEIEDPRAELVRRLQEYERYKKAAENLDDLPRMERDTVKACVNLPVLNSLRPLPVVDLKELLLAFQEVMKRASLTQKHLIQMEPLSVRERMSHILSLLSDELVEFHRLFSASEGRAGAVVSFLAILELLRNSAIEIVQAQALSPIYLRAVKAEPCSL